MSRSESGRAGWYFLAAVIIAYAVAAVLKQGFLAGSALFAVSLLKRILPAFVLVYAIMFLTNYFVSPKTLVKYLGRDSGAKSWLIAIAGGVISTGPIYMWYPMLAELKEKGVREGLIAAFLYARAVKPALIPLMLIYFGITFTIIVTALILLFSVIQGKAVETVTGG
jgi:uncharacterized membrane protein YraQ (UPF0718 family)